MSAERARQLGVALVGDARGAGPPGRLPHDPPAEDPRHDRAGRRRPARARQADAAGRQHRARRDHRRGRARRRGARGPDRRRRPRRVRARADDRVTAVRARLDVVVTPHLGASTVEAQDKAGQTIAEQVVLALRGEFVPYAVNVAAKEANATVAPFLPLAERLGRLLLVLAGGVAGHPRGRLRGRDRRLRLPGPHAGDPQGRARRRGRRAGVVRERAAARGGTRPRRARVDVVVGGRLREPGDARAGASATARSHVAGTLFGKRAEPRIVGINDHSVDVPPVEPHARRAQLRHARDDRPCRHDPRRGGREHRRHGRRHERRRARPR